MAKKIILDTLLTKKIEENRRRKGLTQNEVADYLKISHSTYSRIENGVASSIQKELALQLFELLDLDLDEELITSTKKITFLLTKEDHGKLKYIQNKLIFDSASDTLRFCIVEAFEKLIADDIGDKYLEEFKEVLAESYQKTMRKLVRENKIYNIIFEKLKADGVLDLDKIKDELESFEQKIYHAKKY